MKIHKAYLKRAWGHLLRQGLLAHKGRAAKVFFLGLITTLIQMFAVILLIGAARAYDNGGILNYAQISLDLSKGSGTTRSFYVSLTAGFIILSIIVGVINKVVITNIGRQFFEESLSKMRHRIFDNVLTGQRFSRADTLKILNRDCRYLSLSYLRVLTLLQPALFLIGIFIIGIVFVPIAAMFLAFAGLIVLPFNIYLVLWAAQTSQDIQDSAKLKSAEEKDFIARISTHPFIHHLPEDDLIPQDRPGERGFLDAFVKRQRMGAYSQSITDVMMALVILALALFLFWGGGGTLLLNLSNLVILIILFRFMTGYISQLAQAVTMISSYEPFFRTLLNLDQVPAQKPAHARDTAKLTHPLRLAVFQATDADWSDVNKTKEALNISESLQYVTSDYDITPAQLKDWLHEGAVSTQRIPQTYQNEYNQFSAGSIETLSAPAKLLLAVSYYASLNDHGLLMNGKELSSIDRDVMRYIMAAPADMPLIIVYKNAPRTLILPPRFQLAIMSDKKAEIIGVLTDFVKLRDDIITKLNAAATPQNETEDIFSLDAD